MRGDAEWRTGNLRRCVERSIESAAICFQCKRGIRQNDENAARFIEECHTRMLQRDCLQRPVTRRAVAQKLAERIEEISLALVAAKTEPESAVLCAHPGELQSNQAKILQPDMTG